MAASASVLSLKLDSQLARAFKDYVSRSGKSRSKSARDLLRSALGVTAADAEAGERAMDEIREFHRNRQETPKRKGGRR